MYRVSSSLSRNDVEWRWTTWRKINLKNYWAHTHICTRETGRDVQHCYYVLRGKNTKLFFCYYTFCCYCAQRAHTHMHEPICLSIYRQHKNVAMKIFFFEKFLKKIPFLRINCSDTKYIHYIYMYTWDNGYRQDGQWCALWLHKIEKLEIHLNWLEYWNFMSVRVCVCSVS